MSRGWRWIALLLTAAALSAAGVLRDYGDPAAEVRRWELGYTSRCGWVNWRHARDSGVRSFWKTLNTKLNEAPSFPVEIGYGQEMSGGYGPVRIATRAERWYVVRRQLSLPERKAVAWRIFKETSESFEELQGSWPNGLDRAAAHSSWRTGDLAGNWVAFQTAVEGRTQADVAVELGCWGVEESLRQLEKQPPGQSRQWPVKAEFPPMEEALEFREEKRASWQVRGR